MFSHVIDSQFFCDLFSSAAMRAVFTDDQRLQKWLDFEAALAQAEVTVGIVPEAAAAEITRKAHFALFDKAAIKQGMDKTAHPLVSVIWQLSNLCEGDAGGYVHWGATTQDVMDTGLALHLKDAHAIFLATLDELIGTLSELAARYRDQPMAGRTHGQQALPITFGFKVAVWLAEVRRHKVRLEQAAERALVGQFAGAAGTLAGVKEHGFIVNAKLMELLGLGVPIIGWHTARDGFTEYACDLAMIASTMGKIAHEIIDLQKTEFGEVEEPFEMGKVGSSTMPQKRNPMLCEAVLALARMARPLATVALDAMHHEHERDWSSVQMEWAYLPELCNYVHGAMVMTQRILAGLIVYPHNMERNLHASGGLLLAERVMLALGKQIGRQHAHDIIYEVAMEAFESRRAFSELLKQRAEVTAHLTPEQIDELLNPVMYLGLAAEYVDRVLRDEK
ncbi:MAG: adenylosuccinate lyase [Anaerolineae bacterium]|nr:adenylosuccinate lyase [Anaerolineae bacterium]